MPDVKPTLPTLEPTTAVRRSIQELKESTTPLTIFQIAVSADEAPLWWTPYRDEYLDKFWPTEPFLAGAIFSISSRNAAYRYEISGPRKQAIWAQQLLAQADFGQGWTSMMMKVSQDYLVMGNGAALEVIRPARARSKAGIWYDAIRLPHPETGEYIWHAFDRHTGETKNAYDHDLKITDSPLDLPVGLAHLDSLRITRTGDPLYPAIYRDDKGKEHLLGMHQVILLSEMPSPRKELNGVQHSAVDRALQLAQTLRDILIYKHEKVSGRFARAIHLTNIDAEAISDAVKQAEANADNKGLVRYLQPIIAATLDPNAKPSVETLELASLPDSFDEESSMRWYVAGLALAFGVEFGYLAPLPGNKLGTSTQSETAARQSQGKSSRLFLNTMQYALNYSGILPQNTVVRFNVPDPYEESERDRAYARRARARSIQIADGEITPQVASQMAADVGDLDPKYLPMMGLSDTTPVVTVSGTDVLLEPTEADVRQPIVAPEVFQPQPVPQKSEEPA